MKFLVAHLIMKEILLSQVLKIIHAKYGKIPIFLSSEKTIFFIVK